MNVGYKKFGAMLIFVGIFIPAILYPFAAPTGEALLLQGLALQKGGSVDVKISMLEVVIKEGMYHQRQMNSYYEGRIAFPYKYPFAIGIILIFIGSGIIIFNKLG